MKITHVVAMDAKGGIGLNGGMPWGRLPNELAHFRRVTAGQVMVMGRKTVESLPKSFSLGDRELVGISRSSHTNLEMCWESFTWAIKPIIPAGSENRSLYVCGGAQTYSAFPPDEIIATAIQAEFEADTYYPFADQVLGRTDGEHVCSGEDGGLTWDAWRFICEN